jgi:hypothetical protein
MPLLRETTWKSRIKLGDGINPLALHCTGTLLYEGRVERGPVDLVATHRWSWAEFVRFETRLWRPTYRSGSD